MPLHDLHRLHRAPYRLAESPVWDDRSGKFLWCDILDGTITEMDEHGAGAQVWNLPPTIGSFGLAESGRLVVALRNAVHLFDRESGTLDLLAEIEPDEEETRTNDGKVGPDGAFWVGTMHDRKERRPIGALYRVTASGGVEKKAEGLHVSNGLAWSPDGRTMYHSDSTGAWVDAWDFDPASGAVSGRRSFLKLDDTIGRPDGAAMDAEGCYWSCGVSAGRLNRFSPDGELIEFFELPVPAPTMPCFGGADGRTLVLTSLTDGVSAERVAAYPESGSVLVARTEVAGAPIARFLDQG